VRLTSRHIASFYFKEHFGNKQTHCVGEKRELGEPCRELGEHAERTWRTATKRTRREMGEENWENKRTGTELFIFFLFSFFYKLNRSAK